MKVRLRYDDVFIAHVTDADNIPEKYHFDFNHKQVANNSDTKRIAVRKIIAYPMNLLAEIDFLIDDSNKVQQCIQIHYALIGNQK